MRMRRRSRGRRRRGFVRMGRRRSRRMSRRARPLRIGFRF